MQETWKYSRSSIVLHCCVELSLVWIKHKTVWKTLDTSRLEKTYFYHGVNRYEHSFVVNSNVWSNHTAYLTTWQFLIPLLHARAGDSPTGSPLQLDCWPEPWGLESRTSHTWRRPDRCQWWRAARCICRHTHTHRIMYVLKQNWWENTQLAYHSPICSYKSWYHTNPVTIFHTAVAMATK